MLKLRGFCFLVLFFISHLSATELKVVDNHAFIKQSKGEIKSISLAQAKSSIFSSYESFAIGAAAGAAFGSILSFESNALFTSTNLGGLIALVKSEQLIDVYEINLQLNNGSLVYMVIPIQFAFEAGNKVVLVEHSGGRNIYLDREYYDLSTINEFKNKDIDFSFDGSTTPELYYSKCNKFNRKQRHVGGRASMTCDKKRKLFKAKELIWLYSE